MTLAMEIAVFIACIAFIIWVPVIIVALYRMHAIAARMLHVIEKFREECKPMVQKMDAATERLNLLSVLAQNQWHEVEKIVHTARHWSERADRFVEEVGSIVEPPVFSVGYKLNLMRAGVKTFFQTLLSGNQQHKEEEKEKI